LAAALTALGNNGYLEGITSAFLEAFKESKTAESGIAELFDEIDNFDEGLDLNKGVDFVKSGIEVFEDALENNTFGSPKFKNYYKKLFGKDEWDKFIAAPYGS
jgi:hypothetical protein